MKKGLILLLAVLLGIFLLNTFHEEYPDEYDSITGGKFISQMKVPYRDWFQHHQPGAYQLAAFIQPFSGQSFVRFRVVLALAFFGIHIAGYFLIRSRFRKRPTGFYLVFLFLLAVSSTYFWGEMLLADTLSTYLMLPAFAYLLLMEYFGERYTRRDLITITAFAFLTWYTSMTYIYAVAGITLFAVFRFVQSGWRDNRKTGMLVRESLLITGIPYVLFFAFFLVTGSIGDYYFANVTYNQNYYIYNYPRPPGAPVNPVRYAVVIAVSFLNNYLPALSAISFFNFNEPLVVTFSFSAAALTALLLMRGKWQMAVLYWIILVFSTARGNPQSLKETDYQVAMYMVLTMFSGIFSIAAFRDTADSEKQKMSLRMASGALMVVLGFFYTATALLFFQKFTTKFYAKYMGTMPLVYDRPEIAPVVDRIVSKDDYVYIGPFEFKELFFLKNGRMPTKYHWFLQHAASSKIKDEILADFAKNKPLLVVFKRNYSPWGGNPHEFNYFLTDYLDQEYFRIFMLNQTLTGYEYKWKIGNTQNFDIDGDFNFDKSRKEEVLAKLLDLGLIEKVPKK